MTTILLQADVGANDEAIPTKAQDVAREEFERLPVGPQQREMALIKQSKQFDPAG